MLTSQENDLLCRVEGAAPMGGLMRRHWIPVCLAEEVAEADGAPVHAKVLGEEDRLANARRVERGARRRIEEQPR